jgi:anaphase-promoting complex subunit 8
LVLIDLEREAEALAVLSASVAAFPCNWSAWQALASLCRNRGGAAGVQLPNHWATEFFLAGLCLELQQDEDGLARLQVRWLTDILSRNCKIC